LQTFIFILPNEIIFKIFRFIKDPLTYKSLRSVCKLFCCLAVDFHIQKIPIIHANKYFIDIKENKAICPKIIFLQKGKYPDLDIGNIGLKKKLYPIFMSKNSKINR